MPTITLRAHYDGEKILLDEPFNLRPNTPLLVTIVQPPDSERQEWLYLSAQALADAYGENEPDYTPTLIREPNLDYEGR